MGMIPQVGFAAAALGAILLFTDAAPATNETANAAPVQQASQQQNMACAPRNELIGQLGHQFRENQKAVGTLGEKAVMEVFVSDAGTWTILATDTGGTSCIIAAGKSWDEAPKLVGQEV